MIDRAKTILAKLESDDRSVTLPAAGTPTARPKKKISVTPVDSDRMSLLKRRPLSTPVAAILFHRGEPKQFGPW